MMKISIVVIFLAMLVFAFPQFILAEDVAKEQKEEEEKVIKLEEIVVTAPKEAITVGPTTTVINVKECTKAGTMETVQDLLMNLPAIDMQRSSPLVPEEEESIRLRGFESKRFLVCIDGNPVRKAQAFGLPLVDWSTLTLDNVEKIEVMRGGSSPIYGQNIGGVINIVTTKPKRVETLKPSVTLESRVSEYSTRSYTFNASGGIGSLIYSLAAKRRRSDGFLRNHEFETEEFSGKLSYLFSFGGRLHFKAKYTDLTRELPVINDPTRPDYDPSYPTVTLSNLSPAGDNYYDKIMQTYDLVFEQPTKRGAWKVQLFFNKEDMDWYRTEIRPAFGPHWWGKFLEWGGVVQQRQGFWDRHNFTYGADWVDMYLSDIKHEEWDRKIFKSAAYIQDEWQITPKLTLSLGLRYDYARFYIRGYYPPYVGQSQKKGRDCWTPKMNLTYRFNPKTTTFLSVSRVYRAPTFMEANYIGRPTGIYLEPEKGMQYEVGIVRTIGEKNNLRLSCYYYDISDYITYNLRVTRYHDFTIPIEYWVMNLDEVTLQGVELELTRSFTANLGGFINYTYQDYDIEEKGIPPGWILSDLYELPSNKVNIGIRYKPWAKTLCMLDARWVDDRKSHRYAGSMASYWVIDLGIEQSLPTLKGQLRPRLKFYINNLFDEDYQERFGFPMPGRFVGGALRFEY